MSRKLEYLVIHCTYTPLGRKVTREDIIQWHIKENGWSRVGYADMIHIDGTLENLIPYNDDDIMDSWERSNGVGKKDKEGIWVNGVARHVVLVGGKHGGVSADTRTPEQIITLEKYVRDTIKNVPKIQIAGHYQFDPQKPFCPGFNITDFGLSLGFGPLNIYNPHL